MSYSRPASALQSRNWHELMILQCIVWPSIVHTSEQLDARCSKQIYHHQSATQGLHPVAHKLLLTAPTHGEMSRLS